MLIGVLIMKKMIELNRTRAYRLKITLLLFMLYIVMISPCFSQPKSEHDSNATIFKKNIEFNYYGSGFHNLNVKTDIERLLFPRHNSYVEFFINPSFSGSYGFCIDKSNDLNSYSLSIKQVVNWNEVHDSLQKEFPTKRIDHKTLMSLSKEESREIAEYNNRIYDLSKKEALLRYLINTDTLFISQDLANALHNTIVDLIDKFVGKGKPATIKDGYTATFRCVVNDEVWSFYIKMPSGKFGELTQLCNQIVEDGKANHFNESKYLTILNDILD
jgi:hypothetical protein